MKRAALGLALALSACGANSESTPGESGSEAEIANRAAEIRAEADADINRQIVEINDAANAESPAAPLETANTQ